MTESNDFTGHIVPARKPARTRQRSWEVFIVPILILMTLTVFWGVQDFPFLVLENDDSAAGSVHVASGLSAENAAWAFTTFEGPGWQPLTRLSLMLDATLHEDRAGSFHFTNLLLHLAAVLFLFAALRGLTGESWPAALVAALFAIFPRHVEPVVWIAERQIVLAAFFGMTSLWAFSRYARNRNRIWYLTAVALFACSLMSDVVIVAVPLLLPMLDRWRCDRTSLASESATALPKYGAFVALSVLAVAIIVFGRPAGASSTRTSLAERTGWALTGSLTAIAETLDPREAPQMVPTNVADPAVSKVIGAGLLLASVSIAVVALSPTASFLRVGWFWYLATLIPPLLVGPLSVRAITDSDMYLPRIGLLIVVSGLLFAVASRLPRGRLILTIIVAPALVAVAASSFSLVNNWRDNDALFANPPKSVRFNHRAQYLRGMELLGRDSPDIDHAIDHLQQAVQLQPHDASSHVVLGKLFFDQNRLDAAQQHLRAAVDIQPELAEAHWYLGLVALNSRQPDLAIVHFGEVSGHPEFPQVREYLSLASEYQSPRWQQLRRIEQQGGHYQLASQDPRSAVVMISLVGTSATDADLSGWKEFPRLQSLNLNGTTVTDDGLRHLAAFTELQTLELNNTMVTNDGLAHLVQLTGLQSLALGFTHVDGRGLEHLKSLPNLESLVLGGAQVTDAGLELLHEFAALRKLNLSRTRITDAGLQQLTELSRLESLDLVGTRITDAGLVHLETFPSLQSLNLFGATLTGSGLRHLSHMDKLRKLTLDKTELDDAGLEHLAGLTELEVLTLANTRVTNTGLQQLRPLSGLRQLSLGGNVIDDSGLTHLTGLRRLATLDLSCTQVTAKGVEELRKSLPQVDVTW